MNKIIKIKLNNKWYQVEEQQTLTLITEEGYSSVSIALIQDIKMEDEE